MELAHTAPRDQLVHPVQHIQEEGARLEQAQKLNQIRACYGFALPARMCIEQETIARSKRLGGLESSNLLLHSYNGTLTDLDVQDLYGLPRNNPQIQPAPRAIFETQAFGEELISTQRRSTMLGKR